MATSGPASAPVGHPVQSRGDLLVPLLANVQAHLGGPCRGDQQSGRRVRTLPPRQRALPIIEGALLLTDLLPAWPCACSAGSGSGRCGAIDSEVPVATREIQRRNNQEEVRPSVDAVREAHEARGGLDTATGNVADPKAAEVAVSHWVDQAPHAGARGS